MVGLRESHRERQRQRSLAGRLPASDICFFPEASAGPWVGGRLQGYVTPFCDSETPPPRPFACQLACWAGLWVEGQGGGPSESGAVSCLPSLPGGVPGRAGGFIWDRSVLP